MSWTNGVGYLDSIVKDYLLRRGLNSTLKTFESELKQDKGLQADKILQHLQGFINGHDIDGLLNYWKYLDKKILSHLEQNHMQCVKKVELNLFRLYLVTCMQSGKTKECVEFFDKLTTELQPMSEWKEWFALPYMKNPEVTKPFSIYFTKQWADTFTLSLYNFVGVVLSCTKPPQLVNLLQKDKKNSTNPAYTDQNIPPPYVRALGIPGALCTTPQTVEPQEKRKLPFSKISLGITKSSNQSQLKEQPQHVSKQAEPEASNSASVDTKVNSRTKKSSGYQQQRRQLFGELGPSKDHKKVENIDSVASSSPKKVESVRNKSEIIQQKVGSSASPIVTKPSSPATGQSPKSNVTTPRSPVINNGVVNTQNQETSMPNSLLTVDTTNIYQEHHSAIVQCRYNPANNMAASCDNDGIVKLWQNAPLKTVSSLIAKSHFQSIEWVKSNPNLLLLGASNGLLRVYDSNTRQTLFDTYLNGNPKVINQIKCQPYTNKLAISCLHDEGGYDSTAKMQIWSMTEGKLSLDATVTSTNVTCICFNDSGSVLASGHSDGNVTVSSSSNFKVISTKKVHAGPVNSIKFAPDGKHVFTIGTDGKLRCWDIQTRDNVTTFPVHPMAAGPFEVSGFSGYKQSHEPKGGQLFDLYENYVATCDRKCVVIYKADTTSVSLEKSLTLESHRTPVLCVDWVSSTHNTYCLTGSMDGQLHLSTIVKML